MVKKSDIGGYKVVRSSSLPGFNDMTFFHLCETYSTYRIAL